MPALLPKLTVKQTQTHLQPCPALWESRGHGGPMEAAIILRLLSSISAGDTEEQEEDLAFWSLVPPCKPYRRVALTLRSFSSCDFLFSLSNTQ